MVCMLCWHQTRDFISSDIMFGIKHIHLGSLVRNIALTSPFYMQYPVHGLDVPDAEKH